MKKEIWLKVYAYAKRYLLNKYVLTCAVFAVVLTFCGEHSLIKRIERAAQIRAMEREVENYNAESEQYRKDIQAIQGKPEEIERFARERYYMHADNEEVYVIEED